MTSISGESMWESSSSCYSPAPWQVCQIKTSLIKSLHPNTNKFRKTQIREGFSNLPPRYRYPSSHHAAFAVCQISGSTKLQCQFQEAQPSQWLSIPTLKTGRHEQRCTMFLWYFNQRMLQKTEACLHKDMEQMLHGMVAALSAGAFVPTCSESDRIAGPIFCVSLYTLLCHWRTVSQCCCFSVAFCHPC